MGAPWGRTLHPVDVVFRAMAGAGSGSLILDSFSTPKGSGFLPQAVPPSPTAPHPVHMLPAPQPFPLPLQGKTTRFKHFCHVLSAFGQTPPAGCGQGSDAHHSPPAEPGTLPGSCFDRSPAGWKLPLLKLQPAKSKSPPKARAHLGQTSAGSQE